LRQAADVIAELEANFPNLSRTQWRIKSPWNNAYQCIAWAACDTTKKWWPVRHPLAYWPLPIPPDETVDRFVEAFATLGYRICDKSGFEFGYQKVAVYADDDLTATHMARQHFFGRGWLSKIGDFEDIQHPGLKDIEGDPSPTALNSYGTVRLILRRSWWSAFRNGCLRRCISNAYRFWRYRRQRSDWRTSTNRSTIFI
jgi:hypothetical protein